MMLSKVDARKKVCENSKGGKLLNDIETISKALYLDKTQPRSSFSTVSSRSKSVGKTQLPQPKMQIKDNDKDLMDKEKKSIWSWKNLKAFTNVRNRRFNCCFSLQVHSIEGLPPLFNGISLIVHWKRRDDGSMTQPVPVIQGVAEFEEQLIHSCSVYGSRSGPHHSAKYEAKHFLLYASVSGNPEFDLGKHRVDLTRLLPLTLEELEQEKSSGKWTTSYRLSGKAKGAVMNVSFGYEVIGSNRTETISEKDVLEVRSFKQNSGSTEKLLRQIDQRNKLSTVHRTGILPARSSKLQHSAVDVKDLHEVLPITKSELSDSISTLYQKLDEETLKNPIEPPNPKVDTFPGNIELEKPDLHLCVSDGKENDEAECEVGEFSVIDQGAEVLANAQEQLMEETGRAICGSVGESPSANNALQVVPDGKTRNPSASQFEEDELLVGDSNCKETVCTKESLMKELESVLSSVSNLAKDGLDSQENENEFLPSENHFEVKSNDGVHRKGKSLSFDDMTDTVASEFLELLGLENDPFGLSSETEPESPRERLLRQFEEDALASGHSLFDFGIEEDQSQILYDAPTGSKGGLLPQDYGHSSVLWTSDELPEAEEMRQTRASMLEDLETEALMREWGLNEKVFQYSPPSSSGGFGSPVDMPPEVPDQLPSLGEGLGSFVQTKDGGFLRSMNPSLFRSSKNDGRLIMQVSSPVVMPAEMGSGVMDILQHLASVGIEKLSMQANKLMPMEDITGMTMQQVAWDAAPSLEGPERQDSFLQHESGLGQSISGECRRARAKSSGPRNGKVKPNVVGSDMNSEYVSLEDLAPLAMDKIEALAIEGLRIQSGMSNEEAPVNISPQSIGEFSALEGKVSAGGSIGLEGAGGLQLLDIKGNGDDVDGLMGLSLTLEEWMRLDSGEINDEDLISERTSKLLAAHHATSMDLVRGRTKGEKRRSKGRSCGLLGNNFTVALMVQLRDPLRDYEQVGTPMLALIQVERVFVPPKPKIYSTVSLMRDSNEEDDEPQAATEDKNKELKEEIVPQEEHIPQFKICEIHMAGLKTEPGKKKLWGSTTQQQSGSRWLLANGMGKKNKHPLMKTKAGTKGSQLASSPDTIAAQAGDTLWSISSRVYGTGSKWKELAALNPHIRNPNIALSNETIRLR